MIGFKITDADYGSTTLGKREEGFAPDIRFPEFDTAEALAKWIDEAGEDDCFVTTITRDGDVVRKGKYSETVNNEDGTGIDKDGNDYLVQPIDWFAFDEDDYPALADRE